MTLTGKNRIKKGIIASLCIILTLIVGLSVTLFPNNNKLLGFNTAKAQTTKSEGWQPGTTIHSNYHLLKTVTPKGNGIYDVDVYAANIEHSENAEVFVIWDDSNSMNDSSGNWYTQENKTVQNFLKALRPNFANFRIRLSDFGGTIANNAKDTGWVTANSDTVIANTVNSVIKSSYHWSASKFYKNLAIVAGNSSTSGFTSTTDKTVRIVLLVTDGVVSEAAGVFNEADAKTCINYANTIKQYATIFTACVGGHYESLEVKGKSLMSQIATDSGVTEFDGNYPIKNTPYYTTGSYAGADFVNLESFVRLAAISNEEHFQKGSTSNLSTYLWETINSPYFELYSTPVVTTQAFTGTGFSDTDVACEAQIDITNQNRRIRVFDFDYGAYRCYMLGAAPHGSRLHLHYQIKAQRVTSNINVNTHAYSYIDWKNHDTNYWEEIELPGLNVTLVPEEYKINYHANGGSGTMTSQTAICGTTVSLKPNEFTRSGYAFNGWNTKADGTGVSYENNDSINNSGTSDIDLYAKWTPTHYTIIFEPNGGSGTMSPQRVQYNTNSGLRPNEFTNSYDLTLDANGGKVYERASLTSTYYPNFKGWATLPTGDVVYEDRAFIRNISQPNTTKYLYAKWEAQVQLPAPVRDHYTFVEWNTNKNGSGDGYNAGETITLTSEETLYAIWNPDEFTIKYNLNGGYAPGNITFNNQTGNYETDVTVHNGRPGKDGYTFFGWSTDSGSFTEDSRDYKPNDIITYQDVHQSVTTLNAVYKSSIYLDALGGWFEGTGNEHYNDGDTMAEYIYYTGVITENDYVDIDSFPIPVCPGHRFKGWEDGDENLYEGSVPPENLYLFAIWEEVPTYTITYDANDNEAPYAVGGVPESQEKTEDLPIDISFDPTPTREGHKFLGWSTNPNAASPSYTPSSNVYSINANATMYAVWQLNKYEINYDANGGEGGPTSQDKFYGININISNITPTREKYTFKGWATSDTATVAEYQPKDVCSINENLNLYAVWEKTKYTVTYDYAANGGTSVSVENKQFDPDSDELDLSPEAYKEGWDFVGWSERANSNILIQPNKFILPEQNITVYAVYKKVVETYFSSYDTYNFETNVDTPIPVLTEAYNNDTTVTVFPPDTRPNDIEVLDEYEAGKLKDGCEFTGQYYPRNREFSSSALPSYMSSCFTVDVNETGDALYFDAVYSATPHLYYDSNGGEAIEETSVLQTHRTFGAREAVAFEYPKLEEEHSITETVPVQEGYTFAGWNIPIIDEANERHLQGSKINVSLDSPLALADFPACAQWLSSSISINRIYEINNGEAVDSAVHPGCYITYTVTAETTGAADIVTLLATIPEHTTLVDDVITTPEGKVAFVFENVSENSVLTANYTVKINDDVSNNEIITAEATSELLCKEVDEEGNTSDITFTYGPTSVESIVSFSYHVTYVMNTGESGTCPVDETEYSGSGTDIATLKSNTIQKSGYKFIAWHDKATGAYYSPRANITVSRNIILEPAWLKITNSLKAPDKAPGKPVTYTFTIELPKYFEDITIKDSLPANIRVQTATLTPLTYTADTVDKDAPIINYRDDTIANSNDEVIIHINNTNGVSRYQMVVSGIFDENAKPGSSFVNGITIDVPTVYGVIPSSYVGSSLKYLLTYITGPEYSDTGRYLNDADTKKYSGDDVVFELQKDGSLRYYSRNTVAQLISPPEDKAQNFVAWSNAPLGSEGEILYYSAQESYNVTNNEVFYARYIDIKQEIQNKQDDYIPDEEYTDKISVIAPCTGSMDVIVEGRLGSDLLAIINEDAEFITNIEKEDNQRYIITIDATEGQTYELDIKAKVNTRITHSEELTTGCDVSALVRGNEYKANDDLIDVTEFYTIEYNINGGQGETPVDTRYYRAGDKATLASSEGLSKENYTFSGWCTTSDGHGTNYSDNEEITITENLTLYAIWGYSAVLPETGAQTIAIITAIGTMSLLAIGLYITLKRKSNAVA